MAIQYTLSELRSKLDYLADIENDDHITTAKKDAWINDGIGWFWDQLIMAYPMYSNTKVQFTTTANQSDYALSSSGIIANNNFYKLNGLFVRQNGFLRPVPRLSPTDLLIYKPASQATTIELWYTPHFTKLVNVGDQFDSVNGWDEVVLNHAAVQVKKSKEEGWQKYARDRDEAMERVRKVLQRDRWQGSRVVDTRNIKRFQMFYPNLSSVSGYLLNGSNIELYSNSGFVY